MAKGKEKGENGQEDGEDVEQRVVKVDLGLLCQLDLLVKAYCANFGIVHRDDLFINREDKFSFFQKKDIVEHKNSKIIHVI